MIIDRCHIDRFPRSLPLKLKPPNGWVLGMEAAGVEHALDDGVAGVNFGADAADASLLGFLDNRGDQTCRDAFVPPRLFYEKLDKIKRLATEFRAPLIGGVSVRANSGLVFGDQKNADFTVFDDALKHVPRGFPGCLRMHLVQELICELTQCVKIIQFSRSDIEGVDRCRHGVCIIVERNRDEENSRIRKESRAPICHWSGDSRRYSRTSTGAGTACCCR